MPYHRIAVREQRDPFRNKIRTTVRTGTSVSPDPQRDLGVYSDQQRVQTGSIVGPRGRVIPVRHLRPREGQAPSTRKRLAHLDALCRD